jgi:hypothetical protein
MQYYFTAVRFDGDCVGIDRRIAPERLLDH